MAFNVKREVAWNYGGQPPNKYEFSVNLECELLTQTDTKATFSLVGSVTVTCNENTRTIDFDASDYAILSAASDDPRDYPFTQGTDYFQRTLPFCPNASQSYLDNILMEFRGDIFKGESIPHAVSLYLKGEGVVLPTSRENNTWIFGINTTFTLDLVGESNQEVLVWNHSGCESPTTYRWVGHNAWASMFDFTYRPGMTWDGSDWMSHDRENGGVCNIWVDGWTEMRTKDAGRSSDDPPLCYGANGLKNQYKLGKE